MTNFRHREKLMEKEFAVLITATIDVEGQQIVLDSQCANDESMENTTNSRREKLRRKIYNSVFTLERCKHK